MSFSIQKHKLNEIQNKDFDSLFHGQNVNFYSYILDSSEYNFIIKERSNTAMSIYMQDVLFEVI